MSLREIVEAGEKGLQIESGGIVYQRVYEAGYRFDENGNRKPFVSLMDKCGHSISYTSPDACRIAVTETQEGGDEENA